MLTAHTVLVTVAVMLAVSSSSAAPLDIPCSIDGVDFSSLTSSEGYTATDASGQYTFAFNICGTVSSSNSTLSQCASQSGMVCQLQRSSLVAVASRWTPEQPSSATWTRTDTSYSLQTTNGDTCFPSGTPRTLTFTFTCDALRRKVGTIRVLETHPCRYVIQVTTALACYGEPDAQCGFRGVSLAPLAVDGVRDYSAINAMRTYRYDLNVCNPSTSTNAMCQYKNAGICQLHAGGGFVASLGTWSSARWGPAPNKDGVLATMEGDECIVPEKHARRTTVHFRCVEDLPFGNISVVERAQACEYTFDFPTMHACATPTCGPAGRDFAPLNSTLLKGGSASFHYLVKVCGNMDSGVPSVCKGSSICQLTTDGRFVARVARWEDPLWSSSDVEATATFANGDACPATGQPRTAAVRFVCFNRPQGHMSVTTPTPCSYLFTIPTSYACERNKNYSLLQKLFTSAMQQE